MTIGSDAPATGGVLSGIDGLVYAEYTGAGTTSLILGDSGDATGRSPELTSNEVTGLAPVPIIFVSKKITSLTIDAGTGSDTLSLSSLPTGGITTFNGGSGANTLVGPNARHTWNITGTNAGNVAARSLSPNIQNLTGGSANDTFKFSNGKGVTGVINGGGGTDTLDYSSYTTGVTVNLTTGTATGTGGVTNIENVTGSPANDHDHRQLGQQRPQRRRRHRHPQRRLRRQRHVHPGGHPGRRDDRHRAAAPATRSRAPTSPTPGPSPARTRATSTASPSPASPT